MRLSRVLTALAVLLAAAPAAASASSTMESTFQDDPLIVNTDNPDVMNAALDRIKELGADRIRVSVFWRNVAPSATAEQRPNFDATDPAAYPAEGFARYD